MNDLQKHNLPFISIILPCRNEEKYIGRCLESIIANDYPKDKLEVFVVDGMSEDRTREVIKEFVSKYSNIQLLNNSKKIQASGLNVGIKQARGKFIIIMGTHTIYASNYISECARYLLEGTLDCVGGICVTLPGEESYIGEAISFALSLPFGVGNAYFRIGSKEPKEVDTVPFGCYKKEVFDKIGLFDEDLVRCQDDEFNYRLRKKGGKIILVHEIKSYYYARSTLKSLCKQYFRYGFWKVRVFQKHPKMMQLRQFIPGAFVLGAGFIFIVSIFYTPFFWVFATIILCYLMGSLFFSSKIAKQHSWRYFSVMPIVFSILHISYGMGFLIGLVKFAGRWREDRTTRNGQLP